MGKRPHSTSSAKAPARTLGSRTLILDNGAYSIKAGFADVDSASDQDSDGENDDRETSFSKLSCMSIPNCLARTRQKTTHIGSRVSLIKDYGELQLTRPMDHGMIVNWGLETAVWEEAFFGTGAVLPTDPHDTNLVLTEAPNCPRALQTNCDQIVFEEFEFAGYWKSVPGRLSPFGTTGPVEKPPTTSSPAEVVLLIDAGFSHTTITPVVHGRPVQTAIRRLDLGGKHLTTFLREQLSIRNFSLLDDTMLVNHIKEAVSFTAPSQSHFQLLMDESWKGGGPDGAVEGIVTAADLSAGSPGSPAAAAEAGIKTANWLFDKTSFVDVVLPDFESRFDIEIRPHSLASVLRMRRLLAGNAAMSAGGAEFLLPVGNERFRTPELLFSPADVGLDQAGLHLVVAESLAAIKSAVDQSASGNEDRGGDALMAGLLANIVLAGGSAKIKGLGVRLENELRAMVPQEWAVRVTIPEDPITHTWNSAARLATFYRDHLRTELFVSRQEYLEHGQAWLSRKFAGLAG